MNLRGKYFKISTQHKHNSSDMQDSQNESVNLPTLFQDFSQVVYNYDQLSFTAMFFSNYMLTVCLFMFMNFGSWDCFEKKKRCLLSLPFTLSTFACVFLSLLVLRVGCGI